MTDPITYFRGEHRWLSNFSGCTILAEGLVFGSAEHLYQASKCVNERDIMRFTHYASPSLMASQAKQLGRQVQCRADWEEIKIPVMRHIIELKFGQNKILGKKLIDTGDAELVEGNWHDDTFWGVCLKTNTGENHLGRILMDVRKSLQS